MNILKYIFLLLCLIFPFGQLSAIPVSLSGFTFRLHPLDLVVVFFVSYWILFIKKTKIPSILKPLFVFGVIALLTFAVNISLRPLSEHTEGFLYLLRLLFWIVFPLPILCLIKKYKFNPDKIFIIFGLILGLISILQYLLLPDTRFLKYSGWDDHFFRSIGSFLDPSFNGLFLVLAFISAVEYFFRKNNKNINIQKYFILILLILAIGLTFSRMAYGLFVLYLLIKLLKKNQIKQIVIGFLLFCSLIILLPKPAGEGVNLLRKSTFVGKSKNYLQVISVIKENFILGVGYNNIRSEYFSRNYLFEDDRISSHSGSGADNSFLFVFAVTGVFGFAAYLYFWINLLHKSIRYKNFYVFSVTTCLLASSFFINSLFYSWVFFWMGIVLAKFMDEIQD